MTTKIDVLAVLEEARQLAIRKSTDSLHRRIHLVQMDISALLDLRDKLARLNPHAGEVGEGMLFQLVGEARRLGGEA